MASSKVSGMHSSCDEALPAVKVSLNHGHMRIMLVSMLGPCKARLQEKCFRLGLASPAD